MASRAARKRRYLLRRDGPHCFYCAAIMRTQYDVDHAGVVQPSQLDCTVEHLVDQKHEGSWDRENLVLACRGCNCRRNYMTLEEKLLSRSLEAMMVWGTDQTPASILMRLICVMAPAVSAAGAIVQPGRPGRQSGLLGRDHLELDVPVLGVVADLEHGLAAIADPLDELPDGHPVAEQLIAGVGLGADPLGVGPTDHPDDAVVAAQRGLVGRAEDGAVVNEGDDQTSLLEGGGRAPDGAGPVGELGDGGLVQLLAGTVVDVRQLPEGELLKNVHDSVSCGDTPLMSESYSQSTNV